MPSFDSFRSPRPNIRRAPVVGNGDVLSPQQVTTFNASQGMLRNQAFLESRQQPAPAAPRQAPVSRYSQGATPKAQGVATTGKPIYHVQRPDGALIPVAAISGDRALINQGGKYISPSTGKRYLADPTSPTGMRDIGTEADEIAAKQAAAQAKVAAKEQAAAAKAAEKGADEATKLAHAQKANEFLAQGRAFYHDKVTGEPRAKTSDEEWKAAQAEKGAKLQEAAATKTRRAQLAKLEFDAAQVNIKDKELDDAEKRMALRDAEHVTELERVRCEFAAKVAELEKAVAARDKRIGDLERKLAAKDARIDELLARIDELEKAHHEELEKALADRVHVEEKLAALQAKVNHAQAVSEAAVGDCAETDAGKGAPESASEGG